MERSEPTTDEIVRALHTLMQVTPQWAPTLLATTYCLTSQQRDIERMKGELVRITDELDAEKARADAAVADMKNFCQFCEHYDLEEGEEPCASCMCTDIENKKPSKWVWRGEKGRATE